jgi:hypothetical protein
MSVPIFVRSPDSQFVRTHDALTVPAARRRVLCTFFRGRNIGRMKLAAAVMSRSQISELELAE